MPRAKKNHIAAFFFSLIILVPVLLIAGLQGWQQVLKFRWEERLEREAIQTIKVPLANVVWQEEGREFTVDGEFFDAISYRTEGSYLIATGVFDKEETRIATFLKAHAGRSPQSASIVQLLLVVQCFAAVVYYAFQVTRVDALRNLFWFSINRYPNPFKHIVTPPPRYSFYRRS